MYFEHPSISNNFVFIKLDQQRFSILYFGVSSIGSPFLVRSQNIVWKTTIDFF